LVRWGAPSCARRVLGTLVNTGYFAVLLWCKVRRVPCSDFKSSASAIPPPGRRADINTADAESCRKATWVNLVPLH
jgi:hypothetical protein